MSILDGTTPGPWKILVAGNQWGIAKKKAKRGDDDICGGSQYHDDWKANAKLIASAPTLAAENAELRKLLKRAEALASIASTLDWNEDRNIMGTVHLAGDIRAALSQEPGQ